MPLVPKDRFWFPFAPWRPSRSQSPHFFPELAAMNAQQHYHRSKISNPKMALTLNGFFELFNIFARQVLPESAIHRKRVTPNIPTGSAYQ